MIGKIVGGLFGKVVENAEGILDKVITTDKDRDEAKLALKRLLLEAEQEAFAKEVEDRKSARDMYKDDALIQKILATLFRMITCIPIMDQKVLILLILCISI